MPTNANAYNSRVTDESLEKRFRDTFRSQGGAELVDDLYASGVIVPVVDFTAAAEGSGLAQNLQTAYDFATTTTSVSGAASDIITNAGFWQVQANISASAGAGGPHVAQIRISDGLSTKVIWQISEVGTPGEPIGLSAFPIVVFVRSGDTVSIRSSDASMILDASYRQIATLNGDLVNPSGFSFS